MSALQDKVALVTGAASGIGRATALLFAQQGARVLVADVSAAGAEVVAEIVAAGGQALFQRTDVTDPAQCVALVDTALARWGGLDIAFNNAGISGSLALTEHHSVEAWRQVIDVNLTGVFNCMVPELKAMVARGGGAIVNTASITGLSGAPGAAAYCASKHGVIGLTRTAAMEYGKRQIRINALCPGYIATPMTVGEATSFTPRVIDQVVSQAPIRRLGEPQELAEMVLWLCSDKASFATGGRFVVDGGVTA